ncbi:ABC transporter permease [Paratissierella segnis]|jgi:peptide/nickel transport system permease protein|uniref:ABC transporter permease n=1 Tax=Paratissierella segnis TaxID=2763679 RepID=A0A926ERD3_9FIRM|nr:ABC transporter permease [Paratissierella segnis]MBC8587441.1 ABC transporter permease [Paratissierella segnis]
MKKLIKTLKKSTATAKLGLIITAIWIFCAIFAPLLAPYGPNEVNTSKRFIPPIFAEKGTNEHILGTDEMGRDVLTRIIYGSRISLIVGIMAVVVSLILGTTLGLLAGYYGGWVDSIIMRIVDVMLSFPFIFMALVLMAVLGSGLTNVIVVIGITGWVPYARTVRAQTLSLKEREFITASDTIGCNDMRIILKHILPNIIDSAIILGTLEMSSAILSEASLTFLGMGIPPSMATWGSMVASGREYIYTAWWITALPGLAIFLVCLAINFVGDWVRDVRDPRLRST